MFLWSMSYRLATHWIDPSSLKLEEIQLELIQFALLMQTAYMRTLLVRTRNAVFMAIVKLQSICIISFFMGETMIFAVINPQFSENKWFRLETD